LVGYGCCDFVAKKGYLNEIIDHQSMGAAEPAIAAAEG
jgi:hypothetical protein